ncbi:MAG: signal peptidase II [Lapillicoccus sp.]
MIPGHEADPLTVAPSSARRRRLFALLAILAVLTYALDQVTKYLAVSLLTGEPSKDVIGSFLRLTLIRNPGAAFSLGTGSTWLLTVIAALVLVVVIRTSRRIGSLGWAWALGLLLGGALGNLTDRLVREPGFGQGHVVDFLDYNNWFIGNVADIAIVSSAVLIALLAVRGVGVDGRREQRASASADPAGTPLTPVPPTPPGPPSTPATRAGDDG